MSHQQSLCLFSYLSLSLKMRNSLLFVLITREWVTFASSSIYSSNEFICLNWKSGWRIENIGLGGNKVWGWKVADKVLNFKFLNFKFSLVRKRLWLNIFTSVDAGKEREKIFEFKKTWKMRKFFNTNLESCY